MKKMIQIFTGLILLAVFFTGCAKKPELSAEDTVRVFVQAFSAGDLEEARTYLSDKNYPLTQPQNRLGEVIRTSLRVVSVSGDLSADGVNPMDVTLEMADSLQIMSRALMLYWFEEQKAAGQDLEIPLQDSSKMTEIYQQILPESESDQLPKVTALYIFPLIISGGQYKIVMDPHLEDQLNGNLTNNLENIYKIIEAVP
jgi:hypothetical protein